MLAAAIAMSPEHTMLLVRTMVPDTPMATLVFLVVTYHLVLGFKLLTSNRVGLSFGIAQTVLTHLSVIALLVGIAAMREKIPLLAYLRYLIPALAPFEANWVFNGEKKVDLRGKEIVPTGKLSDAVMASTAGEYEEFLDLLKRQVRPFYKPGRSILEEFHWFLVTHAQKREKAEETAETRGMYWSEWVKEAEALQQSGVGPEAAKAGEPASQAPAGTAA